MPHKKSTYTHGKNYTPKTKTTVKKPRGQMSRRGKTKTTTTPVTSAGARKRPSKAGQLGMALGREAQVTGGAMRGRQRGKMAGKNKPGSAVRDSWDELYDKRRDMVKNQEDKKALGPTRSAKYKASVKAYDKGKRDVSARRNKTMGRKKS